MLFKLRLDNVLTYSCLKLCFTMLSEFPYAKIIELVLRKVLVLIRKNK